MEIVTPTPGLGHGDPGESWEVWIVDMDGDRSSINSMYQPATPKQKRDDLDALVESLAIETVRRSDRASDDLSMIEYLGLHDPS